MASPHTKDTNFKRRSSNELRDLDDRKKSRVADQVPLTQSRMPSPAPPPPRLPVKDYRTGQNYKRSSKRKEDEVVDKLSSTYLIEGAIQDIANRAHSTVAPTPLQMQQKWSKQSRQSDHYKPIDISVSKPLDYAQLGNNSPPRVRRETSYESFVPLPVTTYRSQEPYHAEHLNPNNIPLGQRRSRRRPSPNSGPGHSSIPRPKGQGKYSDDDSGSNANSDSENFGSYASRMKAIVEDREEAYRLLALSDQKFQAQIQESRLLKEQLEVAEKRCNELVKERDIAIRNKGTAVKTRDKPVMSRELSLIMEREIMKKELDEAKREIADLKAQAKKRVPSEKQATNTLKKQLTTKEAEVTAKEVEVTTMKSDQQKNEEELEKLRTFKEIHVEDVRKWKRQLLAYELVIKQDDHAKLKKHVLEVQQDAQIARKHVRVAAEFASEEVMIRYSGAYGVPSNPEASDGAKAQGTRDLATQMAMVKVARKAQKKKRVDNGLEENSGMLEQEEKNMAQNAGRSARMASRRMWKGAD